MAELRYRSTPPRWAGGLVGLSEPAVLGIPLPFAPRLPTHVHPIRDHHTVPAPVLRDLIDHTQRLVFIAAHVAAFGPNPDFSDVRTIDKNVQRIATLSVSPFTEGSFLIPAELDDTAVTVSDRGAERSVTTTAVVDTFTDMMAALAGVPPTVGTPLFATAGGATGLPIGFIQTVEDIGKMIGRHIVRVEYLAATETTPFGRSVTVDQAFVTRATETLSARESRGQLEFIEVTGTLVSLDLKRRRARIETTIEGRRESITVVFDERLQVPLARRMGQVVVLAGEATYERRRLKSLVAFHVTDPDEIAF